MFALGNATQTLARITGKIDFGHFAVIDYIEPAFDLLTNNVGHCVADAVGKYGRIIGLTEMFGDQQCTQIVGAGKAAGVRSQNSVTAPFHDKPPIMAVEAVVHNLPRPAPNLDTGETSG